MKQSHALSYLRQLCCLELDKEIVIREFLTAVQTVIPSGNNGFTEIDERFLPTNVILEFVYAEFIELAPLIIPAYFTVERMAEMGAWFRHNPVLTDVTLFDKNFYQSDLYNLIWRGMDSHHCIQAPVVQNGKPLGMLALNRPRSQRPFNDREQALCARLTPYIAHALSTRGNENICYSENGPSGMMILDVEGRIQYLCETAQRLLTLCQHPAVCLDARKKEPELQTKLTQLCRNLQAIFHGKNAAPPSLSHINPQGRFMFRAYWLNRLNNASGGLIGMTVEHQEPLALKMLRGMQPLPLSPTQKHVALLLAQGFSSEQIGRRLNIKLTTVKDHIGKIYLKLDIHQRDELLPKLLTAGRMLA